MIRQHVARRGGFVRCTAALMVAASLCLPLLGACSTKAKKDVKPTTASPSTSSTVRGPRVGAATQLPFWNFPKKMGGWKTDMIEREGESRAISRKGCYLATGQKMISGTQGSDEDASKSIAEQFFSQLSRKATGLNTEPSGRTKVRSEDGSEVDGVAMTVTYTGEDGKNYRGWYWFRVFRSLTTPLYMQVNYTCPSSSYSEPELAQIVEKSGLSLGGDVPQN